jgi:hypothetical protein
MTPASMGTKALFVASAGALVANAIAKSENREAYERTKKYLSGIFAYAAFARVTQELHLLVPLKRRFCFA